MRSLTYVVLAMLVPAVAQAAAPTCALLDPEKTPQTALLEAKLLADTSTTWVERVNIDKVLKEQKLQAMFSPQGVGERVKLGKLLKADVLVMVRSVKDAKVPALEVVVSETAGGLRLLVRTVPITKDTDADVGALLAAAKAGIQKSGEIVREVIAVPPFVSQDLEFTHDHLKHAFAKLAEVEALDRKGVVVVELAEAEAIAREIALAAPGSKLDRPLPVYLLGEYRHEGKGKELTIGMKLRAERGGTPVVKPEAHTLKSAETPAAVQAWAGSVLDKLAKDDKPRPPGDSKAEAKLLADRGRVFKRLGNWDEAAGLFEASLLLDPTRQELHIEAITALGEIAERDWQTASVDMTRFRGGVRAHRRGLEHLEAFIDKGGDLSLYTSPKLYGASIARWILRFENNRLHIWDKGPEEYRKLLGDARQEQREMLLRIIPTVAKQGKDLETILIAAAIYHFPPTEKYELLEKIIHQLADLPQTKERTIKYVYQGGGSLWYWSKQPEFGRFLDRLGASTNKEIQAAAVYLKERATADNKQVALPARVQPDDSELRPRGAQFTPIVLEFDRADGTSTEHISEFVSAGPGFDVLAVYGGLFVMKEKGKPRRVWGKQGDRVAFTLHYDGRYVWAAGRKYEEPPILLVLDPTTGKVTEVTGKHGLPELTPEQVDDRPELNRLWVASLDPGRACVAGSILGRTWVALATFDPKTGPVVKVIHEARGAVERFNPKQGTGADIGFEPTYMLTLRPTPQPGAKAEPRILLGRRPPTAEISLRPLLIDVDRPAVDVTPAEAICWTTPNCATAGDGVAYFVVGSRYASPNPQHIWRVAAPGGANEKVATGLPSGDIRLLVHDGRLNAVVEMQRFERKEPAQPGGKPETIVIRKNEWWQFDPTTKKLQLLVMDIPRVEGLTVSSHYGLVAIAGAARGVRTKLYAVEFDKTPPTPPVPVAVPKQPK